LTNSLLITLTPNPNDNTWTGITKYRKSVPPSPSRLQELSFGLLKGAFFSSSVTRANHQYYPLLNSDASESLLCIANKRPGWGSIIVQHDNARPNATRLCVEWIQKNGWEYLFFPIHATIRYTLPSSIHLPTFRGRKAKRRSQNYENNEAVQEAVCLCLRTAEEEFCRKGIIRLLERWQ
jgi:hypothetical protein